jgi:putative nucleotidyltransferase with HDIG domain
MPFEEAEDLIRAHVSLPTLPSVVARINSLVDDPEVGTREIGKAVSEDAPIAAKVLKIANSAYYGLRETVLSTEHAAAVLGVRQLRTIALQASVMSQFEHLKRSAFDLDGMWKHSIVTGQACAFIARRCRARIGLAPEEFHVIGLLHDLGKILMLEGLGAAYLDVIRAAELNELELVNCEERLLGYDHAHVGALVASHWGLPTAVVEAIHYHHGPETVFHRDPVVHLVARTNRLVHRLEEHDQGAAAEVFDEDARRAMGLRPTDVEETVQAVSAMLSSVDL